MSPALVRRTLLSGSTDLCWDRSSLPPSLPMPMGFDESEVAQTVVTHGTDLAGRTQPSYVG